MRLFIALDLPEEVVRNLESFVARLRPSAHIHWSPPANLHVTTKFIGEFPENRLPELQAALAGMPERLPIESRWRKWVSFRTRGLLASSGAA